MLDLVLDTHSLIYIICKQNSSPYDERSEARDLDTSRYAFEQHSYEQPRYVQLEPFKPSWSQHLSYYQAWEEGADPESSYVSLQT